MVVYAASPLAAVARPQLASSSSAQRQGRAAARGAALQQRVGGRRALAVIRAVTAPPVAPAPQPSVQELKSVLLDSFYGTERGLSASSDTRAEVSELVSQLEARNPTPQPNEALGKLSGTWRLVYTSNSDLIALLALGRLPLISVGEITQSVDGTAGTVENRIQLLAPFSKTELSAKASFEVRSPKLLSIKFEEGQVSTPELLADVTFPANVEVLGQKLDLTPLQTVLRPIEDPLRSALTQLGSLLSDAPPLQIPLSGTRRASTWLLNTYLDDTLRVTRGDAGGVYVLVKDPPPPSPAAGAEGAVAGYYRPPDWDALADEQPTPVVEPSAVIEDPAQTGSNGPSTPGPSSLL